MNGKQIKDLAEYVLIGHSERRKYFDETEEMLKDKVTAANKWSLKTIFCADNQEGLIPEGVSIVVYEPPTSISPAPADTPENAVESIDIIKKISLANGYSLMTNRYFYGGSVTSKNVADFIGQKEIDGALVGGASVNKEEFVKILSLVK